jgi:hypothetical protein
MFRFLSQLSRLCGKGTAKARSRRTSPARSRNAHLQVEALEERTVMSVLSGTHAVASGGLAGAFAPPQPTAAGLALINSLPNTLVRSAALADYQRDGVISRNDMLDILSKGTSGYTWVTYSAFSSMQTLVNNGGTVGMPDYVQNLASKTLAHDYNREIYTLASEIHGEVNDFFLGQVRPDASYVANGKTVTPTYVQVNLPLWNSSPTYQDVVQGHVGDCWLMASLAEVAARNPGDIQRMFVDNGDGTYTVRLYKGGTPDYVTVDNYLPETVVGNLVIGAVYDNPQGNMWAALAEKAYARENGNGWIGSSHQGVNSYQALDSGYPDWALSAITGHPTSYHSYSGGWGVLSLGSPSMSASVVANDWSQGRFVVLCTGPWPGSSLVVPLHCYALVGYSSGSFTLFNPWGTSGGQYDGKHYPGLIVADGTGLADNFDGLGLADAAAVAQAMTLTASITTPAGTAQGQSALIVSANPQVANALAADPHAANPLAGSAAVDGAADVNNVAKGKKDTGKGKTPKKQPDILVIKLQDVLISGTGPA